MRTLELRDLEILRALLRVRYLTTRQVNDVFFSCPRIGRRRIHKLSDRNLIKPHSKGLPEIWRYTAWRLTSRGLDAIADAFPDEPIPDGLVERVAEGSLHNLEHRDALSRLYLELVVPARDQMPEDASRAEHRQWAASMRALASQIEWQPDGDVVLRYQNFGRRVTIVPDATVVAPARGARIFVELDRSTKSLSRIDDSIEQYGGFGRHYEHVFPDRFARRVLFVVRSEARRANIEGLVRKRNGTGTIFKVLRDDSAAAWLAEKLFAEDDAQPVPVEKPRDSLLETTRAAYRWAVKFLDEQVRRGPLAHVEKTHGEMIREGRARLRAVYDVLKALENGS